MVHFPSWRMVSKDKWIDKVKKIIIIIYLKILFLRIILIIILNNNKINN